VSEDGKVAVNKDTANARLFSSIKPELVVYATPHVAPITQLKAHKNAREI
jgi:hypothetical protein